MWCGGLVLRSFCNFSTIMESHIKYLYAYIGVDTWRNILNVNDISNMSFFLHPPLCVCWERLDYFYCCHSLLAAFPEAISQSNCCHSVFRVKKKKKFNSTRTWQMLSSILVKRTLVVEGDGILICSLCKTKTTCWTVCMWTITMRFWTMSLARISAFSNDLWRAIGDGIILRFVLVRYNCHILWWLSEKNGRQPIPELTNTVCW